MTTLTHKPPVVRRLHADDASDILAIASAYDLARFGRVESRIEDVTPDRPGTTAQWYGVDVDGRLAAFGNVHRQEGEVSVEAEIVGPPDLDREAWSALTVALRDAATALDPSRPIYVFVDADFSDWRTWLESDHGASRVRRFYRMAIDLDVPPQIPELPAGSVIRNVVDGPEDLRRVFDVVDVAFRDHFGSAGDADYDEFVAHACAEGRYDPSLWWLAEVDGAPAAALLARAYDEAGHVSTLGTLREFRGLGLGRALLLTAFAELYGRGLRHISLGVDATNPTGALRLYESVGMHPSVTWDCYELASCGPSPAGSSTSASKNV